MDPLDVYNHSIGTPTTIHLTQDRPGTWPSCTWLYRYDSIRPRQMADCESEEDEEEHEPAGEEGEDEEEESAPACPGRRTSSRCAYGVLCIERLHACVWGATRAVPVYVLMGALAVIAWAKRHVHETTAARERKWAVMGARANFLGQDARSIWAGISTHKKVDHNIRPLTIIWDTLFYPLKEGAERMS